MSTTKVDVFSNRWVEVPTQNQMASLFAQKGNIALTESKTLPMTDADKTALSGVMKSQTNKVHVPMPADVKLYARGLKTDGTLTYSPAEMT